MQNHGNSVMAGGTGLPIGLPLLSLARMSCVVATGCGVSAAERQAELSLLHASERPKTRSASPDNTVTRKGWSDNLPRVGGVPLLAGAPLSAHHTSGALITTTAPAGELAAPRAPPDSAEAVMCRKHGGP